MQPSTLGWISLAVLIVMLMLRIPVAFTIGMLGLVGYWIVAGPGPALSISGLVPFSSVAKYSLSVVPLFVLMGYLAYHAGLAHSLFVSARKWLGHIPGGLPMATVMGGAAFGAASGSGLASTATLARVSVPSMIENGVDRRLAYGVVTSAGPLAQLIPPSILLVVYAIIAEQPVGKLLIAGVVPGLTLAFLYMVLIYVRVRINPELAPPIKPLPWRERLLSVRQAWGIFVLVGVIMECSWT